MTAPEVTNVRWSRKHDLRGTGVTAQSIVYPTSLAELIDVCRDQDPGVRLHAAGSHWGLSTAAMSDHTFIETRDPCNVRPAMARTLHEVVPDCMNWDFLLHMSLRQPLEFGNPELDQSIPYFVHVESGKRVYELYAELDQDAGDDTGGLAQRLARDLHTNAYYGSWGFRTLGSAGGQTVFGALTTGTHGGDFDAPPMADDVAALHLVSDSGRHYWIEPENQPEEIQLTDDDKLAGLYGGLGESFEIVRDDDAFHAVLVGAGRFGVVYSVVLRAVRQYMLHETRVLGTWQDARRHIADRNGWLYRVPASNKFLQIVVCLTPFNGFTQNLVGISKRSDAPWDPATGPPVGREWRVGTPLSGPDPLTGNPRFEHAGNSVSLDPDATDPSKAGSGGFLERACSNGAFLEGIIQETIDEVTTFVETHVVETGSAIAAVGIVGGTAGLLSLAIPLLAIVTLLSGLLAALAAGGGHRMGQVFNQIKDACLGSGDPEQRQAGLFVWQLIAFKAFTSQQGPMDHRAISYAVMDTHDYLDQSCNVNVDSIEVFFEASDPMLVVFVDALIAFEVRQEYEGRAFLGYASLRFTGQGSALLAPQRWQATAVVEVAGLRDVGGVTELVDFAITLSRDRNFSGILHWGQRNESDVGDIEWRFNRNGDLDRWRGALRALSADADTFSSRFTRQTGLEA